MAAPVVRIGKRVVLAAILLWLGALGRPAADQRPSAPPTAVWPRKLAASGIEMRGVRMGMTPAEVVAAGYRLGKVLGHATGAIGYVLEPERPQGIQRMAAYFVHEGLFELSVIYAPVPEPEAWRITREIFARLKPPEDAGDGLLVAARWVRNGVIVRYSAYPVGDALYAPDLLLQDAAGYWEARVFFGRIEYSH